MAQVQDAFILKLSDSLCVRAQRADDYKSLSKHMNNEKILSRLRDRIPNPYTEEAALQWYQYASNEDDHRPSGSWSLETGSTGPLLPQHYIIEIDGDAVGGIGLEFGQDVYYRSAEVGYWLSEEHWGKGVMSLVVPAFAAWAFQTFEVLIRLNAETNEDNIGSQALLKKAGFTLEGRRPNMVCKRGNLDAALYWGMLRSE